VRPQPVFETPPAVPKLPTIDQLHNHSTTALPKWLETKNPRIGHNKFRAITKNFRGLENIFGQQIDFWGRTSNIWGTPKCLRGSLRILAQA